VAEAAEPLRESTDYVADLDVPDENAHAIRDALIGSTWRLYHCTRLLDHERDAVLATGLAPASTELVTRKLADAVTHGYLTSEEVESLYSLQALRSGRGRRSREGRICAVTTRENLEAYSGLFHFFEEWGGELVGMDQPKPVVIRLRQLGAPSVVVVDLTLDSPPARGWHPAFERLLIGRFLGMSEVRGGTNQLVTGTWPVTEIWQPGHPEYDRHERLPQQ
jgi:hypothetical protein